MSYQRPTRLFNRDFLLLWQGQFVSMLGAQAFSVSMIFWVKRQTDSATLLGLAMMSQWVPAILLGPVGGTMADRMSRRRLLILSDLVRGVAASILAALVLLAPERVDLIFGVLLFLSAVMGVGDAFFRPAIAAAIPDLVPTRQVAQANTLNRVTLDISTFLGTGSGGVLFRLLGPGVLFLIDGLTYFFSAFSESFIRLPPPAPTAERKTWREAFADFWAELKAGLRYVAGRKGLRYLLFLAPVDSFFMITIVVLLPFFVDDFLQVPTDWYGFLVAAFGAGSFLGSVLAGSTNLQGRRRMWLFLAAAVGFATASCLLGLTLSPWTAMALTLTAGMMSGFTTIHTVTLMQVTTPSEYRGRVLGLLETLALSSMPLAAGTAGVLADLLGRNIPLIYVGCGGVLLAVALVLVAKREVRDFLSYEVPAEEAQEDDAQETNGKENL
jgi:MFS family permease